MDSIERFFHRIAARGRDDRLVGLNGTLRFDLQDATSVEYWSLTVQDRNIRVSRTYEDADAIFTTSRERFELIVGGEVDYLSAWLRYEVRLHGNFILLLLLRIFLPDKIGARHPREFVREQRKP